MLPIFVRNSQRATLNCIIFCWHPSFVLLPQFLGHQPFMAASVVSYWPAPQSSASEGSFKRFNACLKSTRATTGALCAACSRSKTPSERVTCTHSTRRARTHALCALQLESSSGGGRQRRLLRECSRAACARDRFADVRSFATRLE